MNDFEKMKRGLFYNPEAESVSVPHMRGMLLADKFNRVPLWNQRKKNKIIKKLIPDIGENFWIFDGFHCEYGTNIKTGKNFFCNFNCTISDVSPVTIGDDVMLGINVTIATPCHPLLAKERNAQQYEDGFHDIEYSKPITIGNGVWVASNVVISGGVTIGDNVVIGAGAVVTKDIPSNSLVYGVPARVVRTLDEKDKMDVWNTYIKEETPLSLRDKK